MYNTFGPNTVNTVTNGLFTFLPYTYLFVLSRRFSIPCYCFLDWMYINRRVFLFYNSLLYIPKRFYLMSMTQYQGSTSFLWFVLFTRGLFLRVQYPYSISLTTFGLCYSCKTSVGYFCLCDMCVFNFWFPFFLSYKEQPLIRSVFYHLITETTTNCSFWSFKS